MSGNDWPEPAAGEPSLPAPTGPVNFTVPGEPVGKGRARSFVIKGGARAGHVGHHTPAKTRTYEGIVRSLAMDAMRGRAPISAPVILSFVAYCSVPASWPNWKREAALAGKVAPTSKPDLDNVEKALLDSLNAVVFGDDSFVCKVQKAKAYSDTPRIEVVVWPMPAAHSHQYVTKSLCALDGKMVGA